ETDTQTFSTFDPSGFTNTAFPGISIANGINDSGDIVGDVINNENTGTQAYIKKGDVVSLYNHPNADPSRGTSFGGINNDGVCVGSYTDNTGMPHGIVQDGDETFVLDDNPSIPPNEGTFLFDINDRGQMVGGYFDPVNDVQHGLFVDGNAFITLDFP